MRIRAALSGIIAGVFCLIALWFPWYMVEPARLAPDWSLLRQARSFPGWLPTAVTIFCGLTIFAFGWVSARWNWSKTWRSSLLAGAGSGLIAGCIVYDFIGAFHFGLLGQAGILGSFYEDMGEIEGLTLIVNSITDSATLLYLNFIAVVFAGTVSGALGGLASSIDLEDVWGGSPRDPDPWLFRIPAYTLPLTGLGWMILMIAALTVLQENLVDTVIKNDLRNLNSFPAFILITAWLACLTMILPPIGMTWGWIVRDWRRAGLWRVLYGIWLAVSLYLTGWIFYRFILAGNASFVFDAFGPFPFWFIWAVAVGSIVIGASAGLLSAPATSSGGRYRPADWFGYALTQGILGGTQALISVPAFALVVVMITLENIPHLTRTGLVQYSPAQQIIKLFDAMTVAAEVSILVCAVGGWIFALLILSMRKFLKIKPAAGVQDPGSPLPAG